MGNRFVNAGVAEQNMVTVGARLSRAGLRPWVYSIAEPSFTMPDRRWDVQDWYANIEKARNHLDWSPHIGFTEGLRRTTEWFRALPDKPRYLDRKSVV